MRISTLSIIIPAYNEAPTIHLILDKIKETELPNNIGKEIILVNDCSTDNTEEVLQKYIKDNKSCVKSFSRQLHQYHKMFIAT